MFADSPLLTDFGMTTNPLAAENAIRTWAVVAFSFFAIPATTGESVNLGRPIASATVRLYTLSNSNDALLFPRGEYAVITMFFSLQ